MSRPSLPPKPAIRMAFNRAADQYDGSARIQRRICDALIQRVPDSCQTGYVLDAGCGTGYGLEHLRQRLPQARCLALDFAPAMLGQLPPATPCLAGDVEALPLAGASLDGYWSSLTLQWCDGPQALREAARVLRPGAWLAITSLAPQTFHEVRHAFAGVDAYQHTLGFSAPEDYQQWLHAADFTFIQVHQTCLVEYFDHLKQLLRAVKGVGANRVGAGHRAGLMGRSTWQQVEARYEALRQPEGLPLTYDVLFITAIR